MVEEERQAYITNPNGQANKKGANASFTAARWLGLVGASWTRQPYYSSLFKANSFANKTHTTLWKQLFHFYPFNQERFMEPYHKRSNVESTFSMIKAKFGDRLRSRTVTSQINEALCKVLCHNLCCVIHSIFELGIEPTFWAEPEGA